MHTKKILEVKNITKIYKVYKSNFDRLKEIFFKKVYHKEFVSNDDISFELYEGETLGIIGTNGAGKSTILKIIAGVTTPTSGRVIKKGRVTALLELGTGFNNEISGYENIFLNGTLIGMSEAQCMEKAKEIIEFSELGAYIDEPIKTYSSGMKMRLAFSIALFSEPQILIVDEALSVGDAHFSAKCTKALAQRKKQNMSIIYVSHDLNSLKLLCDRLVMLNKGRLVEAGTPEDVINKYNFLITKLNDSKQECRITDNIKNSFGHFDIEIKDVSIKGERSTTNTIVSGEVAIIETIIHSKIDVKDITVGIRIKDKFGQDIFGTNTFYHGQNIDYKKDEIVKCIYKIPLNIGVGKYFISMALHSENTHLTNCAHFIEEACNFEIINSSEAYFIGLCNLKTDIKYERVENE